MDPVAIFFLFFGLFLFFVLAYLCWYALHDSKVPQKPVLPKIAIPKPAKFQVSTSGAIRGEGSHFASRGRTTEGIRPNPPSPGTLESQRHTQNTPLSALTPWPRPLNVNKAQKVQTPLTARPINAPRSYDKTGPVISGKTGSSPSPVSPLDTTHFDNVELSPVSPVRQSWPELPTRPQKTRSAIFQKELSVMEHFKESFGKKEGQMF